MGLFIIGLASGIAVSQLVDFIRSVELHRRLDRAAVIMAELEAKARAEAAAKPAEPTPDPSEW